MPNDTFARIIQIIPTMLLKSVMLSIVSFVYILFYDFSRKTKYLDEKTFLEQKTQLAMCLGFNLFIFTLRELQNEQFMKNIGPIFYLFCIIGDIDILICKIPTELLLFNFLIELYYLPSTTNIYLKIACILLNMLWFLVKDRLGISLYDILLILIQSLLFQDIRILLFFDAFILILWGVWGVFLKARYMKSSSGKPKNGDKEKARIPLAPVIITAFILSQLIS